MRRASGLRYVAYVRKSEERKERQELSHQAQTAAIKRTFPDLNIVKWLEPESKSAFRPGRPIFDEMLDMIDHGEADGIVAWHPNRLSRNELDAARVTYALRSKLKDLKFCNYTFENNPENVMMLQMVMSQGQYESTKQAVDVRRGMAQKAANGERPGQVPQGYLKVPILDADGRPIIKPKDKKVVTKTAKDPERYDLVKKMWAMLLSGKYNASQIRKIANNEWGFTTRQTAKMGGVPLTQSMIYKIFNNPYYTGWIWHEGEMHKGNHPAMIDLKDFDYAQTLLGEKGKPRQGAYLHAYTSLIRCATCGCTVVGKTQLKLIKSTQTMKAYGYYHCTRKSEKRPCNQTKYKPVEALEQEIDEELGKYTILPEFRDLALKILRRNNQVEVKDRTQIYQTQQKKRQDIQAQLDRLVDMRTRDLLDDEEYTLQRNRLKLERVKTDEKLRDTETRADDWMALSEKAFEFATYARIHFQEGDMMTKRDILRTLGENLLLKDGKLFVQPNEWLIPIAEHYPELEKRYLWARTNQKATSKDKEVALERIFESWRARRDLNPRHSA